MNERLTFYFPQTQKQFEAGRQHGFVAGLTDTCDLNFATYLSGNLKIISRQHFRVTYYAEAGYALIDLGSLNGTAVNGQRLKPGEPRFLRHGDVVILARNPEFRIDVSVDDSNLTVAATGTSSSVQSKLPERSALCYIPAVDQFVIAGFKVPHSYFTKLEHHLLRYFCEHSGQVLSFDELAFHVWHSDIQNNTIAKTISKVRQKLDALSLNGAALIQTIYGWGFRFTPEGEEEMPG